MTTDWIRVILLISMSMLDISTTNLINSQIVNVVDGGVFGGAA